MVAAAAGEARHPQHSLRRLRGCAVLALFAACRGTPAPQPLIVSVAITVVPATAGSAEFQVERSGAIRGGHFSGDSVPFVHQAEGRLDSASVDSLWALASALDSAAANATPASGRGYVALQLTFTTGAAWVTSWPEGAVAPDARVRAVADWLLARRIGGW